MLQFLNRLGVPERVSLFGVCLFKNKNESGMGSVQAIDRVVGIIRSLKL
jgi:hypothetical protein